MTYRLALVFGLAGLGGCGALAPGACTLIGCQDGLMVQLATVPSGDFRVELRATSPTSQPVYVFVCGSNTSCQHGVFFPGYGEDQAFVTVVTSAGARTTEVTGIRYRLTRPNGPNCPPECRQATVAADVPS